MALRYEQVVGPNSQISTQQIVSLRQLPDGAALEQVHLHHILLQLLMQEVLGDECERVLGEVRLILLELMELLGCQR